MSKLIAFLPVAAVLGLAALPGAAAAADLYGYGGDERPLAFHSRDDVYLDGGRARLVHRDDLGPAGYGERRGPGPVVFDERGGPRRTGEGYGYPEQPPRPRWGYGGPAAFAPPPPPPYGYGPGPYRPAAVYGAAAAGPDFGEPEGGCTVERARTITPAGWEKTVTHRTCYRR